MALLLLIAGGLFVGTLRHLHRVDAGFRGGSVLLVSEDGPREGYRGATAAAFYEGLLQRVEQLPGMESASYSLITPLAGGWISHNITVNGQEESHEIYFNSISRGYIVTSSDASRERAKAVFSRSAPAGPPEVPRNAGAIPNRMAVAHAVAPGNPGCPLPRDSPVTRLPAHANRTPTAAPKSESSKPSVINWRTIRPRLAPIASRTAISRCRAAEQAAKMRIVLIIFRFT